MTAAVPAFFERVPMNDAGHVGAARRSARDRSVVRLVAGELERTLAQDCALACRDLVNRTDLRWTDILGQILDNASCPRTNCPSDAPEVNDLRLGSSTGAYRLSSPMMRGRIVRLPAT
jgi:hypothetical protein